MQIFFHKRWKHHGVILEIQDVWHKPQINILPSWFSLEVSATYPTVPVHLFIHTVKSFTQGEPDVCFPLSSFPWKLLGFIASALKAWMVDATHSISLSNLQKGFPSAESVSQNETYFCAPRKNVWWSRDSNMKTARCALWNRSRFGETARVAKNKRAPDVCLVESGHQNQTRRLAQRFCWLEPAVPPHSLPLYSLIPPLTFLFLPCSPHLLVFALLVLLLNSFSQNSFCILSLCPVTLPSIPPLSPCNPPALSLSLLFHTFISELLEDSRGWGGWEGFSFSFFWARTAVVSYDCPPPLKSALHANRLF